MKSTTIVLAAIVLAMAGRVSAADANTDAKKAIQVGVNKAMHLIVQGKFDELTKMCTTDCTFKDKGQTMSVTQSVSMMKSEMAQCKGVKMTSTLLTCSVKGGVATCKSHDTMTATVQGADKKPHKLVADGTSTDTFVKSGSTWLMKSSATISETMTMDGKPYNPSAAANNQAKP